MQKCNRAKNLNPVLLRRRKAGDSWQMETPEMWEAGNSLLLVTRVNLLLYPWFCRGYCQWRDLECIRSDYKALGVKVKAVGVSL